MSFSDHASWHRMLSGPADLAMVGKPSAAAAVPTARKRRRDDRDVLRIGGSLSVVHLPRTPRGYSRADNPGIEGKPARRPACWWMAIRRYYCRAGRAFATIHLEEP